MPHTPRRWLLRESTANMHQAVDDAVGGFETVEQYRRYVREVSVFRLPVERALMDTDWPKSFSGWRPTVVGDAIASDLDDLDIDTPSAEAVFVPQDAEGLLGVLYVLEGSSLGAQILLKRAVGLGLSAQFGARHLAEQAAGVNQWRGFLDLLEAAPVLDMNRVVESSRMTFQLAQHAFKSSHT